MLHNEFSLCHIQVHKDKMTDASAHYKQMENFVGAKVFMFGIKDRQLERIDDAAHGIDDTTCQKP